MSEWKELTYRHYALVNNYGLIVAEVRASWPPRVYCYKGNRYVGLEAAKAAAETATLNEQEAA